MAKVKISNKAMQDIDQIEDYHSESAAKKQIKAIYKRFDDLEQQPLMGRPIPELDDKNVRHINAGKYRVIYHVIAEYLLMVLRVFHSRRNLNPDDDLDFNN